MPNPHLPPSASGISTYATEAGVMARARAGRLAVTLEGLADEAEAEAVMVQVLGELARRRGKMPAKVADRTTARLREALERG